MTSAPMRWLVAILISMSLAGCIGEDRRVAHAKCETDLAKLRGRLTDQYTFNEELFIASCMRSHRYGLRSH
jgi:hypothetical protein